MNAIPIFAALFTLTASALAQAPGVRIESSSPQKADEPLLEKARVLREAGKFLTTTQISDQLKAPAPGPVLLPEIQTKPLRAREVADRARQGYVRVGWYYLCRNCDHWHLKLAGGYAIAPQTIATCHHCVEPTNGEMREGYLVAADAAGNIMPVTAVLARSKIMDCAILRVEGGRYTPLPLNPGVGPGDPAFCHSDPLGVLGYFSTGIVNRFFWLPNKGGAPGSNEELQFLRVNVSTDWAPGSSGAAILDECANVLGHVATISPMTEGRKPPAAAPAPKKSVEKEAPAKDAEGPTPAPKEAPQPKPQPTDRFGGATLITLHAAIPAQGALALVRQSNRESEAKVATEKAEAAKREQAKQAAEATAEPAVPSGVK